MINRFSKEKESEGHQLPSALTTYQWPTTTYPTKVGIYHNLNHHNLNSLI